MADTAPSKMTKKNKKIALGVVIVILLIVAFLWYKKSNKKENSTTVTDNTSENLSDKGSKTPVTESLSDTLTQETKSELTKAPMDEKA
jgi:cytoskeletal protein RodZ